MECHLKAILKLLELYYVPWKALGLYAAVGRGSRILIPPDHFHESETYPMGVHLTCREYDTRIDSVSNRSAFTCSDDIFSYFRFYPFWYLQNDMKLTFILQVNTFQNHQWHFDHIPTLILGRCPRSLLIQPWVLVRILFECLSCSGGRRSGCLKVDNWDELVLFLKAKHAVM